MKGDTRTTHTAHRCFPPTERTASLIILVRRDHEFAAIDHVRRCKNPFCPDVFTSREALLSLIEGNVHIVQELASRIAALPDASRKLLLQLIQAA